ncbi:GNAT family N-acetyltransferase [Nonomuraea jabiensis]|uniref:GNAT family N-acetyltransferase n=1 Tax=Nonomuraea jabiensis TaxID=882448 RepID=UPI0036A1680E
MGHVLDAPGAAVQLASRAWDQAAVLPEHRRRGLARWIKAEQTLRLHERFSHVRAVTTTVNQQNVPMVAVNRALGYRTVGVRLLVEGPVTGK